jgi:GntR family transcriptional regulator
VHARDRFVAEAADRESAELLQIEPGDPVMRYKRTARDKSGKVMEFTVSLYRADQYQFVIEYES